MTLRNSARSTSRLSSCIQRNVVTRNMVLDVSSTFPTCCNEEYTEFTPPVSLMGREQEGSKIWSFLWRNIIRQQSGFLSLVGKPGTGKSATLSLLCRQLRSACDKVKKPPTSSRLKSEQNVSLALAFCNCVNYSSGKEPDFWKDLLSRLEGTDEGSSGRRNVSNRKYIDSDDDDGSDDSAVPDSLFGGRSQRKGVKPSLASDAKAKVERLILHQPKSAGHGSIIVVLDEIDLLEKQKWGREVVKRLTTWTLESNSKLILVGCGNTLADITKPLCPTSSVLLASKNHSHSLRRSASTPSEKLSPSSMQRRDVKKNVHQTPSEKVVDVALPTDVSGHLTFETVRFEPYTADQIAAIIQNELENNGDDDVTLSDAAKQFLAKRIAKDSGDVRQAKDALRLAMASLQQLSSSHALSNVRPSEKRVHRRNTHRLMMQAPDSEKNITEVIDRAFQTMSRSFSVQHYNGDESDADGRLEGDKQLLVEDQPSLRCHKNAIASFPCTPKKSRVNKCKSPIGEEDHDNESDSAWESSSGRFDGQSCSSSGSETNYLMTSAAALPKLTQDDATPKAKQITPVIETNGNIDGEPRTPGKIRAASPMRRRPSPYMARNSPSPRKAKQQSQFQTPVKQAKSNGICATRTPVGLPCTPLSKLQVRTPTKISNAQALGHPGNVMAVENAVESATPSKQKKEIGVFDIVKTLNQYAPQGDQVLHKSKQVLSLKQKIILNCFLPQQHTSSGRSYGSHACAERFRLTFADLCEKYRQTCDHVKLIGANESETELYNMVEMLDGLGFLQVERKAAKTTTPLKRFNSTGSMLMRGGASFCGGNIRQHVIVLRKSHRDIEHVIGSDKNLFENIVS